MEAIVALAGFVAGFLNVVAGGGSFLTLPALVAAGLTALGANASSTVALFPAQAVTAILARRTMAMPAADDGISFGVMSAISLFGGFVGAVLLLVTPNGVFMQIVPWLILFSTGVFAVGRSIGERARSLGLGRRGVYAIQSLVAVYGGYFGGGIGIMMLAALTVFGFTDIRKMTGIKIILAMLMNVAAVLVFSITGLVQWRQTLVVGGAALAGGLVGMANANSVPTGWVRAFIVGIGVLLTIGFFLKASG